MRLALVLAAVMAAGSVGAGVAHASPIAMRATKARVAQTPTPLDLAIAAVGKAETARATLVATQRDLTRRYQDQLGEIDKLKRQQASWRRDRALRGKLADSLETARALSALADRIKRADAEIARAKDAAIAAIDVALAKATGTRKAELERRRRAWAPPPAAPRHIVIPDDALDPLADPEELDQQAAGLRDSEAELAREAERLGQQATRFDRMAELRRQHDRSQELATADDSDPRRIAAYGAEAAVSSDAAAAPTSDSLVGERGNDSRDFATALADVVDPATVDALRKADQSSDPATRAAAVRRARDAVADRLATLRKRRAAIESRARELRLHE